MGKLSTQIDDLGFELVAEDATLVVEKMSLAAFIKPEMFDATSDIIANVANKVMGLCSDQVFGSIHNVNIEIVGTVDGKQVKLSVPWTKLYSGISLAKGWYEDAKGKRIDELSPGTTYREVSLAIKTLFLGGEFGSTGGHVFHNLNLVRINNRIVLFDRVDESITAGYRTGYLANDLVDLTKCCVAVKEAKEGTAFATFNPGVVRNGTTGLRLANAGSIAGAAKGSTATSNKRA